MICEEKISEKTSKMCPFIEERTEEEIAAANALLELAMNWRQRLENNPSATINIVQPTVNQQPNTSMNTSALQPFKKRKFLWLELDREPKSVISSVDCDGQEQRSVFLTPAPTPSPILKDEVEPNATPTVPEKSKSGRMVKRIQRSIPHSEDKDKPKTRPTKPQTPKTKRNSTDNKPDEVHPAKKIKTEKIKTEVVDGAGKENGNGSKNALKVIDIFADNFIKSIQLDTVRHSRLFETAYEMGNCADANASVDFQIRAIENLAVYRTQIKIKQKQVVSNRSAGMMNLMKKFRNIKNRQQVCSEFVSTFEATKSTQWKPFLEDPERLSNIYNYNKSQAAKQPTIKYLINKFVVESNNKEKSRKILVEIFKLLPNRPEFRHTFVNIYLSSLVTAYRKLAKKNTNLAIKKETKKINA